MTDHRDTSQKPIFLPEYPQFRYDYSRVFLTSKTIIIRFLKNLNLQVEGKKKFIACLRRRPFALSAGCRFRKRLPHSPIIVMYPSFRIFNGFAFASASASAQRNISETPIPVNTL